jgi:hypothetical protein
MNPQDYQEAVKSLNELSDKEEKINVASESQRIKIKNSYGDKIRALEDARDAEVDVITEKKTKALGVLKAQEVPYRETIAKAERFFNFMHRLVTGQSVTIPELSYRADEQGRLCSYESHMLKAKPVAVIRSDLHNKIYLYIYPNRKTVNKFSLSIKGNASLLMERESIKVNIKDAPTEEALLGYMNRNIDKIRAMVNLQQLDELSAEYETAIKLFEEKSWKVLYLKHRKYYYEERYSMGTSTQEYKDICAILTQLQKNQKDLVLLVGHVTSEEGTQLLEKLLGV